LGMSETFRYQSSFGATTPWGDLMTWREGEKPIHWVTEVHLLEPLGRESLHKNVLIVTNQRILYVDQRGKSSGVPAVLMERNLEDVLFATMADHGPLRVIEKGGGSIEIESTDIEGLSHAPKVINEAVSARRAEFQAQGNKEIAIVGLDFPKLMTALDRAGVVVSKLKCHSCGSQIEVPKLGDSAECEYCGAVVYARETAIRLKETIS
jgi:DNA-directed RNA polymerase subunit RPC12/RpoP